MEWIDSNDFICMYAYVVYRSNRMEMQHIEIRHALLRHSSIGMYQ